MIAPRVYYNENDDKAARWLRVLINEGLIPDGDIDKRSILDVRPTDLARYVQCHFFAGIGGWPYALRLAGWPDDRPVWTGSCPCQGHSSAARGRHVAPDLWPPFQALIAAKHPVSIFGEQVATTQAWFDRVCDDLENLDYTLWAAVLPACSVGLDHVGERLYFAGQTHREGQSVGPLDGEVARVPRPGRDAAVTMSTDGVPHRMALMRGFGNAIVPELAEAFIRASEDVRQRIVR